MTLVVPMLVKSSAPRVKVPAPVLLMMLELVRVRLPPAL